MVNEAEVLGLECLAAALERRAAAAELTEMFGPDPDPNSVEAWLQATPKQKQQSATLFAIWSTFDAPVWKRRR